MLKNTIFLLALCGFIVVSTKAQNHGDDCSKDAHCNRAAKLICATDTNTCACFDGRHEQHDFQLEWEESTNMCVSSDKCIGEPVDPEKQVSCKQNFECVQSKNYPLGVGKCQAKRRSHGEQCNKDDYCAKGLVCGADNRCACGEDHFLGTDVYYQLSWSPDTMKCVASASSGCVGTANNPEPYAEKIIECQNGLTCTQLQDQPSGIGVCMDKLTSNPPPENSAPEISKMSGFMIFSAVLIYFKSVLMSL